MSSDWEDGYDTAVREYEPMLRECEATEDALTAILTGLIAELWSMAEHDDHLTEWIGPNLERAEERLREVQGE